MDAYDIIILIAAAGGIATLVLCTFIKDLQKWALLSNKLMSYAEWAMIIVFIYILFNETT